MLRSKGFHDAWYGRMETAGGLEDHIAALKQLAVRLMVYLDTFPELRDDAGDTAEPDSRARWDRAQ